MMIVCDGTHPRPARDVDNFVALCEPKIRGTGASGGLLSDAYPKQGQCPRLELARGR